jgi:hypothetical protein
MKQMTNHDDTSLGGQLGPEASRRPRRRVVRPVLSAALLLAVIASLLFTMPSSASAQRGGPIDFGPLELSYVDLVVSPGWTERVEVNGVQQRTVWVTNGGNQPVAAGAQVRLETVDPDDRLVGVVVLQAPDRKGGYFERNSWGFGWRWVTTTHPGAQTRFVPGLPAPQSMVVDLPFALQPGEKALISVGVSGTPRLFQATADPYKRIFELSEGNNTSRSFHIADVPQ